MNVAVIGAGAIGLAYAALLESRGHRVTLLSPTGASTQNLAAGAPLVASGRIEGEFAPAVAQDMASALADAETAILAVPSNGARAMIDAMAPLLRPGQVAILSSQSSLSALYLSKRLAERGGGIPVVAWSTTAVMGRRLGPGRVDVDTIRPRIDRVILHESSAGDGARVCAALFGEVFRDLSDLLGISLSNLNPPIHLANSLANFTRMERGEDWDNYDGITPAVGRMIEALDAERLAVAAAWGHAVRTAREHYLLTFDYLAPGTVAEMAAQVHRRLQGPPGPKTVEHRFLTEDIPFGLVPVIELGRMRGVALPLHEAGIRVVSALMGRDLAAGNDLLGELLPGIAPDELQRMARDGWPAG